MRNLLHGTPPALDLAEDLAVGFQTDLQVFEEEYFAEYSFVVDSSTQGNTFKLVEAYYGGGKSHYLNAVQARALKLGFLAARVELTLKECPLTSLERVFFAAMRSLTSESMALSAESPRAGIQWVMKEFLERRCPSEDPVQEAQEAVQTIGDLPFVPLRQAVTRLALALASEDRNTSDLLLAYLTEGRMSPDLRRLGIASPIDLKSGSTALRSLSYLARHLGYNGLVLVLDEGDRSASLSTTKEKRGAANNLVHLINQMSTSDWRSTVLLYSIPSWEDLTATMGEHPALLDRVSKTGFPDVPPSPRIVLDTREQTDKQKRAFCVELGRRVNTLFTRAYPAQNRFPDVQEVERLASKILLEEHDVRYKRQFVQEYVAKLYEFRTRGAL